VSSPETRKNDHHVPLRRKWGVVQCCEKEKVYNLEQKQKNKKKLVPFPKKTKKKKNNFSFSFFSLFFSPSISFTSNMVRPAFLSSRQARIYSGQPGGSPLFKENWILIQIFHSNRLTRPTSSGRSLRTSFSSRSMTSSRSLPPSVLPRSPVEPPPSSARCNFSSSSFIL